MSSKNLGEQEGKPDYGLIFDDFPNCWAGFPHEYAVISDDYQSLFEIALGKITIEDLQKAREYGCKKYTRKNWLESRGTADHDRFMSANRRSIYRHLVALRHEDVDTESGCLHWALIALRCMIAIEYSHLDVVMETREPVFGEYGFQGNRLTGEPIEEKKTIYDWSKIDKKYNWAATDLGGDIYAYAKKPEIHSIDPRWFCTIGDKLVEHKIEQCDDWEDSLEARPMTLDRIGDLNDAL